MSYELSTTRKSLSKQIDKLHWLLYENHDELKKVIELAFGLEVISIDAENDEIVFNNDESALRDRAFVGQFLCVDDISRFQQPGYPSEIVRYIEDHNDYPDDVVPWQPFEHYAAGILLNDFYNAS